jgi:hypothetical protein
MERTLDEETLLSTFRRLDDSGRKKLLRHALQEYRLETAAAGRSTAAATGQCKLQRGEERPEMFAEPIFTE